MTGYMNFIYNSGVTQQVGVAMMVCCSYSNKSYLGIQ